MRIKKIADERDDRSAAVANQTAYNKSEAKSYGKGAPHLKHKSVRKLYIELVGTLFNRAKNINSVPRVLDIGAGEGSVTISFLEFGARVTATDISGNQLTKLKSRCERFGEMLEVRCEDVSDTLQDSTEKYDIVVMSSFLHHVPDYLEMIQKATTKLANSGQLFIFQDPLRYDSMGRFDLLFSNFAYLSWRMLQGDLIGGLKRRVRRSRGIYLEDSIFDNTEYHVTRNGVDQEAIYTMLNEKGWDCSLITYFSTQNTIFQTIGDVFGLKNTFGFIAKKNVP